MFCLQIQYVFKIHVCIYISINCLCHSQYNELSVCIFPAPVLCTIIFCVILSLPNCFTTACVKNFVLNLVITKFYSLCVHVEYRFCWYQWVAWIVWTCQLFKLISWKADQYIYNSGVNCVNWRLKSLELHWFVWSKQFYVLRGVDACGHLYTI